HDHRIFMFHSARPYQPDRSDTTIEVLMHDLPAEIAGRFRFGTSPPAGLAAEIGIADMLPGFRIDEHVFSPEGYSINAVKGDLYWTLHITPQTVGSYVSFETNF